MDNKIVDSRAIVRYFDAMPAAENSSAQRLATLLLGRDVRIWITDLRADGVSWRHIAADLKYETDGQVDVSYETVRLWAAQVAA